MNSVEIAEDGQTVKIGGGALQIEVVDTLWAANKQTSMYSHLPPQCCKLMSLSSHRSL